MGWGLDGCVRRGRAPRELLTKGKKDVVVNMFLPKERMGGEEADAPLMSW
jgi:hypothetical protein